VRVAENTERFFVLTGGPGSGKSTLIDALQQAGFSRSIEAGRSIIQDQVSIGGHAVPWNNRALFAELMLVWEMRSYHMAEQLTGPIFFDRGVPDVLGYLRLSNLPVPAYFEKAAQTFRYHRRVFIAPPWPEIFQPDRERKQDFEEAVRTYEALAATYQALQYELVELPRVPIAERVRFVLQSSGLTLPH
jgi:predicted ATPase